MGYFALISDITSSLFRPGSPQERSSGGREVDTGCCSVQEIEGVHPKRTQKAALQKSEAAEYRAWGAAKRGFWANRQNREIATWGNAAKNRPKNAAFIHAELDKRGISA